MTTQKQIEANRENSKKGGVKTPEGKEISKYNAIKHGLLSREVLLEDENEDDLVELNKKLKTELKPIGGLEMLLVDRIGANFWRLRRALSMEDGEVISKHTGGLMYEADKIFRYEIMLERSIYKALHELQRLQASRKGGNSPLPIAVDVDVNEDK